MKKILLIMVLFLASSLYGQQTSLLHKAVEDNKYVKAEFALKTGSDVNSFGSFRNYTSLMIAAKNGNLRMVKLLIRYGAKLDIKDKNFDKHYTALLYAIEGDHVKVVKYLLKKGANSKIVAVTGKIGQNEITARDLAKNKPSMDYLFIDPSELLLQSTKAKDLKGIIRSLKLGAKINVKDKNGWTPLMIAMGEGSKKIIRYIKRKGGKTSFQIPSKVIYDSDGATSGEVPIDKKKYLSGKQVVILGSVSDQIKREGFRFDSWEDGNGKEYRVGSKLTMGIYDIRLHAKWSPTYKVIYDSSGATSGKVPIDKREYLSGKSVVILGSMSEQLKREGFRFDSWEDSNGKECRVGSKLTMGIENIRLYVKWSPIYKILYKSNYATEGTVPVDKKGYTKGSVAVVLGDVGKLKKKGFSFGGWIIINESSHGSRTQVSYGKTLKAGQKLHFGKKILL